MDIHRNWMIVYRPATILAKKKTVRFSIFHFDCVFEKTATTTYTILARSKPLEEEMMNSISNAKLHVIRCYIRSHVNQFVASISGLRNENEMKLMKTQEKLDKSQWKLYRRR